MIEFQEKQKTRRLIYSSWSLIVISIVAAIMFFSLVKVYLKSREAKARKEEIATLLEAAVERNKSLRDGISRLEDEFGMEEEIRRRFDVAKPGEKIIMIINKEGETSAEPVKKDGFFLKIWRFINIFD